MKTITELKALYDIMYSNYSPDFKKMSVLDATDATNLWKAIGAKFPPYQVLPDTNLVSYVKNNILASLYTVQKGADLIPTSKDDQQLVMDLNIVREKEWAKSMVGYYQFLAGERAALLNVGYTMVTWDETLKRNVLKNINPLKFMRDPFAENLKKAAYCVEFDELHETAFTSDVKYAEEFKKYKASAASPDPVVQIPGAPNKGAAKDYYTLLRYYVKETNENGDELVNEYHVINNQGILYSKEDIQPSQFPIVELHCNPPAGRLIGVSEPARIFANNIAYNLMDSITMTAEYKNQRPPKFVNGQSGLNIQAFMKHGDEADRTFVVNGPSDKAVTYHQFPQPSPLIGNLRMGLLKDIQLVSGVDGRYTGRDTGSIITTGGTEEMLNRVTLIDTPKILEYEMYTKDLSELIMKNLIHFAPKQTYFFKKPNTTTWISKEVDFPNVSNEIVMEYGLNVSSELPKNKQRMAAWADQIMKDQMQYQQQGSSIQLITEEEWLMMQDIPNKEYFLERMGLQRMTDALTEVSQTLFGYADLVKKGMSPDEAMMAMAEQLKSSRMGETQDQGMMPAVMPPMSSGGQPTM